MAALAAAAGDPDERLALEWAALRVDPHPSFGALEAFANAHPTWPGLGYVRYRQEAELLVHPQSPATVEEFFAAEPPQSSAGKLAVARAEAAKGRTDEAIRMVRALWRDGNFDAWTESSILRDFGVVLLKADHKYRADRLLYAENYAAAFRAAAARRPRGDGARSGALRRRAWPAEPGARQGRAGGAQERPEPSVRPHSGRAPIEPSL